MPSGRLSVLAVASLLLFSWALAQHNPERMPGPGMRLSPVVGYDDSSFLVVWEDWHKADESDIMGARVDGNLAVIDSNSIRISVAQRNQCTPAIAVNGQMYLVVWEDYRHGRPAVYGARVAHGAVLDTPGVRISPAGTGALHPAVSSSDSVFLVVWQEVIADSAPHIAGARITLSGQVEDTIPIRISRQPGWQANPDVAYDYSRQWFGAIWESHSTEDDSSLISGTRVSLQGAVLDSTGVRLCTLESHQTEPAITFGGPLGYFAVWQDDRRDSTAIYGNWLDSLLIPLRPAGVAIDSSAHAQLRPTVAEHSTYYQWLCIVHWQERRHSEFWEIIDAQVSYTHIFSFGIPLADSFDLTTPVYTFGWWGGIHHPDIGLTVMTGTGTGIPGVYQTWGIVAGVEEPIPRNAGRTLTLSPIPASRFCTVGWSTVNPGSSAIQVFDVAGRMRKHMSFSASFAGEQQATIDVADLSPGIYLVLVNNRDTHLTGRLVIQR